MPPELQAARQMAHRILTCEQRRHGASGDTLVAAELVLAHLREHLSKWFGADGFDALLARAVDRARSTHPVLVAVDLTAERGHQLDRLWETAQVRDAAALHEAVTALFAALLALLVRLIGDDLVTRLTFQIWPPTAPNTDSSTARTASRD